MTCPGAYLYRPLEEDAERQFRRELHSLRWWAAGLSVAALAWGAWFWRLLTGKP